jgi:hypothetical protein
MNGPEILDNFMKAGPAKALKRGFSATSPEEMSCSTVLRRFAGLRIFPRRPPSG